MMCESLEGIELALLLAFCVNGHIRFIADTTHCHFVTFHTHLALSPLTLAAGILLYFHIYNAPIHVYWQAK